MIRAVDHKVSVSKSFIWRVMGVFVLAAVTYFFTRHWVITTRITITHHVFFFGVFYLHERLWTRIRRVRGRTRSVVKSIVYEIFLGMGFGGLIVFFYTGSFPMVTRIIITYTAIKLVMYYFYDRLWHELKFDKEGCYAVR